MIMTIAKKVERRLSVVESVVTATTSGPSASASPFCIALFCGHL